MRKTVTLSTPSWWASTVFFIFWSILINLITLLRTTGFNSLSLESLNNISTHLSKDESTSSLSLFIRNDNGVQCSYVGTWSDDLENSGVLNTKLLSNNTGDVTINWIGEAKQLTLSGYLKLMDMLIVKIQLIQEIELLNMYMLLRLKVKNAKEIYSLIRCLVNMFVRKILLINMIRQVIALLW